ncbi:hypothetical protein FO470_14510 [Starkeya sp. 3C]|uniref:PsiF repeat-containing protein n=1 Tax=Ancylobacter moscoviensis TaxID=2597768 RepID=A0ABY3DQ69_9HYPH|nr:hypothetical protein [Ancylobacter moscoviensis]TSJ61670.1 hypothetical protein FO470_14510 [Ancylobacter moscoviensis]
MKRTAPLRLLIPAMLVAMTAGALAQSAPSPAKVCADRWNEMKAKNQTGDQTYRDFSQKCLVDVGGKAAKTDSGKTDSGKADSGKSDSGARTATPAADSAPKRTTPTGPNATAAQPTIKQCADRWNEMKAKNQTGNQTYRDFAQQCLAGSPAAIKEDAAPKSEGKDGAAKPRTSVPSVSSRQTSEAAGRKSKDSDENDREALNRCNSEWQDYKAKNSLSGAKAWHVFMARCLP